MLQADEAATTRCRTGTQVEAASVAAITATILDQESGTNFIVKVSADDLEEIILAKLCFPADIELFERRFAGVTDPGGETFAFRITKAPITDMPRAPEMEERAA